MFSFKKDPTLIQVDYLYKHIVSKFPMTNQVNYCESLIYRTRKDIADSKCVHQKRKLKKLLNATIKELKKLNT